jgi:pimeloyl-ACP methyl ester carboxylesterase
MKWISSRFMLILSIAVLLGLGFVPSPSVDAARTANSVPVSTMKEQPLTFVLVHGAWVDSKFWTETAEALRKSGHIVYTPEYAGYGSAEHLKVTHEQITKSIADYIKQKDLHNIVLVGHSFGGSIIQKVAEQVPDRIKRLVFFDAFVLPDGQSVDDQFPPSAKQFFAQLQKSSDNNTITLPFPFFRDTFVNTASLAQAKALYKMTLTEPAGLLYEKLDLKKFYSLDIPKSYLYLTEDTALPQGPYGWHPTQSGHLGVYRFIEGTGDHMTTVHTEPKEIADGLVKAGRD